MSNEFEKHKPLSEHIQRMASTGYVGNVHDWNSFLSDLNYMLIKSESEHRKAMVELLDEAHRNVVANFRGVNSEGLYNVNGFINSLKQRIGEQNE